MSDDFDLEGIGLTLDDLDLADDDLPPLPLDRPRYQPKGWWTPTPLEDFHLDLPDFRDGAERTRYMVEQMARAALKGASDDTAMFPYMGDVVSLNELLDAMETPTIRLLNG